MTPRARVAAIAIVLAGLACEGRAEAKCVDAGCIVGWVYVVVVPVVLAGATLFFVDVYETATDIGDAGSRRAPSLERATFEQGAGGVQAGIGGAVAVALATSGDTDSAFATLAITSWPLALAMHGTWGERRDPFGGFPMEALPIAGVDLGVLAYDVSRLARRDRPKTAYGFAEALGALPQVGFGVAAAIGGRGADAPATLALCAIPTLLLAHGIHEMAKPRAPTDAPPAKAPASWRLLPTLAREPSRATVGVSIVGRF